MEKRFSGKTAVVTGGGSGIGKAVALRLAKEGASVLVADIQDDKAREVAEEIVKGGGRAAAFKVNLGNIGEIDLMIDKAAEYWGGLDILVNSAGLVKSQPFFEVTEQDYDRIVDINMKGTAFCIQKACARMVSQIPADRRAQVSSDRCNGKIVNLSSISGRRGRAYQLHYAATKAAVISLTQSAALAVAQYGINVNAICPSVVKTPMWEQNIADKAKSFGVDALKESDEFIAKIPMRRPGTSEEMAAAVCFLCSQDSDYITGQTLNVDGGFEMD